MSKLSAIQKINHQLFNEKSGLYARSRPRYPQKLYAFIHSSCDNHEMAWDAACGSGQAAVDLAKYFNCVQATDISKRQIANALQDSNIRYSVQPSESTNFKENQFDFVGVAQALHWFDLDAFWPELRRVLKPAGIFVAWGYSWFRIDQKIDQ